MNQPDIISQSVDLGGFKGELGQYITKGLDSEDITPSRKNLSDELGEMLGQRASARVLAT
ncbi:MAG: hypothetical protein ABJL67_03165 [Sulfitobacter sp.]